MFQKFIINRDGVLKFGHVYLHRDMLAPGEQCTYGGGLWKIDEGRGAIVLYGRSFDFGPPDFDFVKQIDWTGFSTFRNSLIYMQLPCQLFSRHKYTSKTSKCHVL